MIGQKLMDEMADCGSFFDQIDDLLDFPVEDVEAGLPPSNRDSFPSIWSTQSESIPCSDSVFSGNSDLSAELSVPYEDIAQLEWLSTFVEDSFSGECLTLNSLDSSMIESKEPLQYHFNTSSPVSVLDSSSSCSGSAEKPYPWSHESVTPKGNRCGRARSKRPRPATFNPRPPIQILPPGGALESGIASPRASSESENAVESRPVKLRIPKPSKNPELKHKKKKIKSTFPLSPMDGNQNPPPSAQAVRKCLHCEITKTPQWRAGPMGPKTLCNACGVRYKSGRLFPEYRPAASPTFVPSIHSNSHKKVLEMRTKGEGEGDLGITLIPNATAALDYSI